MKSQNSFFSFSCETWDTGKGQGSCTLQALRVNDICLLKLWYTTIFCCHSIIRKMKMLGCTSSETVLVQCTDDLVSPSLGLHACIATRLWNSVWRRAAVQLNYFIRLLEFYGRFSSIPSKADHFTHFGALLFQTKSECSKIWHKWASLFPFYLRANFYLLVMP